MRRLCVCVLLVLACLASTAQASDATAVRTVLRNHFLGWEKANAPLFCSTFAARSRTDFVSLYSSIAGHPLRTCAAAAKYFFKHPSLSHTAQQWRAVFHDIAKNPVGLSDDNRFAIVYVEGQQQYLSKLHGRWLYGT